MCYMTTLALTLPRSARPRGLVGVRELRQNLSVYLARIAKGETLEVTDRGVPVALLMPLPPASTLVQKLVASGRATAGVRDGADLPAVSSRIPRGLSARLQVALQDLREDRV
jgi:prevent-host-death family protein